MITIDDFEKVQREVAELNRRYDETNGRFKEMRKSVRKRFGCKKLPEAKKLLEELHKEMTDIADEYLKKFKVYKKELGRAKKRMK